MNVTENFAKLTEFGEARVQSRALVELHKEDRHALQAEFEQAAIATYVDRYPKRKAPTTFAEVAGKKDGPEVIEAIRAPFDERAREIIDEQKAEREAADAALARLAPSHPIADTRKTVFSKVGETWTSTYSSQGWGAKKYAENAAERMADDFRAHGVKVRVVWTPTSYGGTFVLWAATDHESAAAVRHLPGLDLVEVVRLCWARGVNPRVYYPFLPHGFEEKHGLDYQGRRTK